jgi:putative Holliday junction resolvase
MPESSRPKIVLAFDFGLRRIGVACGDTLSRNTSALETVPSGPDGPRWDLIASMMRDWQPDMAVVGLPYNVDDSENAMTAAARSFAAEVARRFGVEVVMVDERYSSLEAGARLQAARETGLRRRRVAKSDVDAAAACVILERWFTEKT